jgi:hypothetical protein
MSRLGIGIGAKVDATKGRDDVMYIYVKLLFKSKFFIPPSSDT